MIAGEVKHVIEVARQRRQNAVIGDRSQHEIDGRMLGHVADIGREQVVHDDEAARRGVDQSAHQRAADKAGAADDEYGGTGKCRCRGHDGCPARRWV